MQFAQQHDMQFEVLELFAPPALGNDELLKPCIAWHAAHNRVHSIHGAFVDINPASGDPEIRALSRRRCHESCAIARRLGAKYVVIHGSCFPFLRGGYISFWAERCSSFFEELASAYPDVTVCIENSMDIDPTPLEMLMERIHAPNVCVCLDIGHARYSGTPIREWFERLGDRIEYLHLSDNLGRFDDHLPIGDGVIDWVEADALCRALDRPLTVTLELDTLDDVRQSIDYMREKGLFGF